MCVSVCACVVFILFVDWQELGKVIGVLLLLFGGVFKLSAVYITYIYLFILLVFECVGLRN